MKVREKYKAKSQKHKPSTNVSTEITNGTLVCMKNSPIYQSGSIGKKNFKISFFLFLIEMKYIIMYLFEFVQLLP